MMLSTRLITGPLSTFALLFATIMAGCSQPSEPAAHHTPTVSPSGDSSAAQSVAPSRLGDLTPLRDLAVDASVLVQEGKLSAAKDHIKELELAWDSAEAGLKPRAPDDWHTLDKAIDRALTMLRKQDPSQTECETAMSDLLKTFDQLGR